MEFVPEDLLKVALAVVLGGAIGFEREHRDKAAGLRTVILITLGAALFTMMSQKIGLLVKGDGTRIASGVVSGVGFLGAGAILHGKGRVLGLTTAATIWVAAAIGMTVGGGDYILAGAVTLITVIVLLLLAKVESYIDAKYETRRYEIVAERSKEKIAALEKRFRELNLIVKAHQRNRDDSSMTCTWDLIGRQADHDYIASQLFDDEALREFRQPPI